MTHDTLNHWLDRRLRPRLLLFGRRGQAFHVCGSIGWVAGISLAVFLTRTAGLRVWVTAILALAALATFVGLTLFVKVLSGEENIVYYHHEIAVALVSAAVLWLLGQPVLPYLDAVFMGLGLFLACGRVGCLMVGCCHGRPHRWGVRYGPEHADAGFARPLAGVRFFPIQLVEAAFVAGLVAVGTVTLVHGAAPGWVVALYSVVYGLARFGFEFLRGDTGRPYLGGFSEAQWTTLVLMGATSAAELAGVLPLSWWHVAATMVLAAMVALAVAARPGPGLLRPSHVLQVAQILGEARTRARADGEILIGETSLGVRISASRVQEPGRGVEIFSFSSCDGEPLRDRIARRLARLIARLQPGATAGDLVRGATGVFHLVVPGQEADRGL